MPQTEPAISNSMLIQVPYSTVLTAIENTNSNPFRMTICCQAEWTAIAQCVNQGIDAYLEVVCHPDDVFNNGFCSLTPHSLCVLLRRLGDTDYRDTKECSADEIWDAANSLQSCVLTVLGIDDDGRFVGRDVMGLD